MFLLFFYCFVLIRISAVVENRTVEPGSSLSIQNMEKAQKAIDYFGADVNSTDEGVRLLPLFELFEYNKYDIYEYY